MKELTSVECCEVSGGIWQFVAGYVAGHVLDFTISNLLEGNIDYTSVAEQSGSGYNMMGA